MAEIDDIGRQDYRDWALCNIIRAQATAGRVLAARTNIRRLSDLRLILVSLRETAAFLAEVGYHVKAFHVSETIPTPRNRACALLAIATTTSDAPRYSSPCWLCCRNSKTGAAQ